MNIHINWDKLSRLPYSENVSFEKFCFHIAKKIFAEYGTVSYFYNTPGSEFYIELNKPLNYDGKYYCQGDVIGWQAKYWRGAKDDANSPLGYGHRKELEDGFSKTNGYRPNIKLWIICTPGSFVQKEWDNLTIALSAINVNCSFISWHKDIFESFLIDAPRQFNGIFQYHFGSQYIDVACVNSVSKDTKECLKTKYDVDLHTPTDFESAFLSVVDKDVVFSTLIMTIKSLKRHIDQEFKHGILNQNHWGYTTLTAEFREAYVDDVNKRRSLCDDLSVLIENKKVIDIEKVDELIHRYLKARRSRVECLNRETKQIYNKNKEEYRNLAYYLDELAAKIRKVEDSISSEHNHESIVSILNFYSRKDFAIFAEAGYGKTHLACSLADNHLVKGLPVLFLMGASFRNCNSIESKIKELMQQPADLTTDDLLDSLDYLAFLYECKLPIIIDGLNEAAPSENRWKDELPPLVRKIRERNNLVLVTTCREKTDYIQVIYGKKEYSQVENSILLNGIALENLDITVQKYFKKYNIHPINVDIPADFSNPLLLKVFCIINEGRNNFILDEYSLASCMQDYSDRLIQSMATKDGRVDRIVKHEIELGLNNVSQLIWETNNRCLGVFTEFLPAFKGSHLDEFLKEGMCFMVDRNDGEEQIMFSYDMVAGYHIAKSIIASNPTNIEFVNYVNENKARFFGNDRHTLAEDVNKSLFYLVPVKYGKQWFELMDDSDIVTACIDHFDIIVSKQNGRHALIDLLVKDIDANLKQKLLDTLYRRSIKLGNISYISLFIPLFLQLTQEEWDRYWNCKFAQYDSLLDAYSVLHDSYKSEKFSLIDRVCFASILCGITDYEYRKKYHILLQDFTWYDFLSTKDVLQSLLYVHDPFIFESVLSVIAGAGLRTDKKCVICESIKIIEKFFQSHDSNHIILLDDLETLYSYADYKFGLKYDRNLLNNNRGKVWPIIKHEDYTYCNFYSYDFDKYNIRPLYQSYTHLTADEIYSMLFSRITSMGYNVAVYRDLEKREYEEAKYRSSKKCNYSHKYGRHALMELYGWLILNDYIKSEYKGTFRTAMVDIDPSAPKFSPMRTYFSQSFLPRNLASIDKWLTKESCMDIMVKQTNVILPKRDGEWILLRGYFSQQTDKSFSKLYLSRTCYLIPEELNEEQISKLYLRESVDYHHAFASELGWRKLEEQDESVDKHQCETLLAQYSFSSWDSGRFQYSHFYLLNPEIAHKIELVFDVRKMNYYLNGEEVSAYYVNDKDQFFFLRKDVLNSILKLYKARIKCHIYEYRMVADNLPDGVPEISDRFVSNEKDFLLE